MPKTPKEKRAEQRANFLERRARRSYRHTTGLNRSLTEDGQEAGPSSPSESFRVCAQCNPILSRYAGVFKDLVHQGTELRKKKRINPYPKRANAIPYRDVKRQNEWLRANVFDAMGNYLYCCECVCSSLGISKQRLANQRKIKRKESQQPLVEMTKQEAEEQRLGEYVVMPIGTETAFKKWWKDLSNSAVVTIRYPHARHGNSGRTSNSAKTTVRENFLEFVDVNSQPNGRSSDSSGPTHYFIPKFSTIQTPKLGIPNYEARKERSVVGEFNRVQTESGRDECSNGSSHNWLKMYRPKVAICPHQEDYCDTCAKKKVEIRTKQTTINRLKAAAASEAENIQCIEDEMKSVQQSLEQHRQEAQGAHKYFVDVTKRCEEEWKEIVELEARSLTLTRDEEERLTVLKHKFNAVLSADYQMCKLVPYWGQSPQPGSTYYFQKLNHDIFGIVNHASNSSAVYLFDERIGPKNTDHTVSYLYHYISTLPGWIRRIHLFLDNTCSTNKNFYTMAWAWELVQQGKVDFLRVSFLIAGHTKFSPDLLFSKIAMTYNHSDIFTTEELKDIISEYADVTVDEGSIVHDWRSALGKYSKFPGIRSLHNFIFTKNSVTQGVYAKVRTQCYTGSFHNAS